MEPEFDAHFRRFKLTRHDKVWSVVNKTLMYVAHVQACAFHANVSLDGRRLKRNV